MSFWGKGSHWPKDGSYSTPVKGSIPPPCMTTLDTCSGLASVAVINMVTMYGFHVVEGFVCLFIGRVYFILQLQVTFHHWGKSGKKLKTGIYGRRDHSGQLLPAWFPLACSVTFLLKTQPSCLPMVLPTVGWVLLHQSRKCSRDTPTGHLRKTSLQLKFPLHRCL